MLNVPEAMRNWYWSS